ncbi:MAG: RsmE family RNA methyltransferase [Opitutales bacterium]
MANYRSFLFPGARISEDALVLDTRESHHLVRVFRAPAGASVEVLDGCGRRYSGILEVANARAARIGVSEVRTEPAPTPAMTLLQALPKGKAMDLVLRMATEIGATTIRPVFTDQGAVRMSGDRLRAKMDKWSLTMIEACKQCGLAHLPDLAEPELLRDSLKRERDEDPAGDVLRVVASLEADCRPLCEVLRTSAPFSRVVAAIGPEGDFSAEEYRLFREAGFKPVLLGANVLRAETAAAYILSVTDQLLRVPQQGE